MNNTLIPIYLILGFLVFKFLLTVFYPVFVFFHEAAHAITAIALGAKNVGVTLGKETNEKPKKLTILGIELSIYQSMFKTGSTNFEKLESKLKYTLVAIAGPVISLGLAFVGIAVWRKLDLNFLRLFILSAAWLANFHILFNACWPFQRSPEYQSDIRNILDQ